jgi:hypothetical protein
VEADPDVEVDVDVCEVEGADEVCVVTVLDRKLEG